MVVVVKYNWYVVVIVNVDPWYDLSSIGTLAYKNKIYGK